MTDIWADNWSPTPAMEEAMKHRDQQWVLLGGEAHKLLLEQGYTPALEQTRHGVRWVLMTKEV